MENIIPNPPAKLPADLRFWAREMRGKMTDAEALLWKLIRNRHIADAKFRRQHPVGRYILDFYCVEQKLAIELDGSQHADALKYDERRDAWLRTQGIEVLRFWNNQVLMETEAVLEAIFYALTTTLPSPACGRGGINTCTDMINRCDISSLYHALRKPKSRKCFLISTRPYSPLPQAGEGPGVRVLERRTPMKTSNPPRKIQVTFSALTMTVPTIALTPNPSPACGRGE